MRVVEFVVVLLRVVEFNVVEFVVVLLRVVEFKVVDVIELFPITL